MHAEKFDHGTILDQTPYPGIDIQNAESCTIPGLVDLLAPLGAEMLVCGIRNHVFVPPIEDVGWYSTVSNPKEWRSAPKVTPEDRHVKWDSWTGEEIMRRYRVLGPLWNTISMQCGHAGSEKRLIFSGLSLREGDLGEVLPTYQLGLPYAEIDSSKSVPGTPVFSGNLMLRTLNGSILGIVKLKVEGSDEEDATVAATKVGLFNPDPIIIEVDGRRREFWVFRDGLS